MGLLSSIQKIALTPSAVIGKEILKVVKPSSSIAQQPISTTTSQLQSTTFGKVLGTAIAGTTVALGVSSIGAGAIAKTVVANPGKALIVGAVTPAVLQIVADKPSSVYKVPSEVASFSSDVGGLVSNPTLESLGNLIEQHKTASIITAGAGALVIGKSVIPAIATFNQTQAVKEQTEAIKASTGGLVASLPSSSSDGTLQTDTSQIQTPATQSISSTKRKRRSVKVQQATRISQRVNVNVSNIANKRYLNAVSYVR